MKKHFISAENIYNDSVKLAVQIHSSGFRPNYIVGIWRGGAFPGCIVQDVLSYGGIKSDHISIRTSGRDDAHRIKDAIEVYNLGYLVERVNSEDSVLLVDDVFDSGLTINAVLKNLAHKTGKNLPADIRVATVYYKPDNNQTILTPDYFVHKTSGDTWLVFPHEFDGLTEEEIREHKGTMGAYVLESLKRKF